jgi:probable rRNA maturation factor
MKLIFVDEANSNTDKAIFNSILQAAQTCKTLPREDVELLLTTNAEIQKLNKKYRQKDEATDVLSFPMEDEESLGQIVISVDKATAQAKELNQTLEEELKFLFAHGLLHLLGHDHKTPEDEEKMLAETYKLLGRK